MPNQINLFLVKPGAQQVCEFDGVRNQLFGGERVADVFAIGFAGGPAVPLNHYEFLFEASLKSMSQIHRRHSGAAVQKQQNRQGSVTSANKNVLLRAPDAQALQ